MKNHSLVFAATLALAALCPTQSPPQWTAPGMSFDGSDDFWNFTKNPALIGLTNHARPLWAISAHKMPSDPAGTFTVCLNVRALVMPWNPGFSGFIIAKYTPGAATPLVLTSQANGLNEAFVDYNLNLEPIVRDRKGKAVGGGRYGVFDRFRLLTGGVLQHLGAYVATRTDDKGNFGKGSLITGITGTDNYADPTIGYVDGTLKLFYSASGKDGNGNDVFGVWMQDLDVAASAVKGTRVLVVRGNARGVGQPAWEPHSPTLVHGADGDVEGMFVCEGDGSATFDRSDNFFAADLDPETPHPLTFASTGWLSSGAPAGGTFVFCDSVISGIGRYGEGAWLVGDEVGPGDSADVTMSAYSEPGTSATALLFAGPWLPQPVQLPGVFGSLGIFTLPIGVAKTDADQQAVWRMQVPKHGAKGLTLPIQAMALHKAGGDTVRTLTNTATIRVRG